jgi:hypothetical protein
MGVALSCRDRAILRAVAKGGAELVAGAEPDLFLDGRSCADQSAAHRLARAGLIATTGTGAPGSRVAARLTAVGYDALGSGTNVVVIPTTSARAYSLTG